MSVSRISHDVGRLDKTVIQTTCAYCGVGCGITATVTDPDLHLVEISGREDHPANYGRLCSKGSALGETVSLEGRLLSPKIGGKAVVWSKALDEVASRLTDTLKRYGPESIALYGSGQLLTEDYYVANKLMKGFIGSANMDTNSRLCMASTVAGQKRAFGSDTVPNNYQDLELADLLILSGSNTAWCHPVLFQRIRAIKEQRPEMKVVVIDPRRTDTCDIADLHLAIHPGSDVLLFNGLLSYLADHDALDQPFIEQWCSGFDAALGAAENSFDTLTDLAERCGEDIEKILRFYHWFLRTPKTVTAWSQGVNQSLSGTDKVNAIINCHLATGRIGQPGRGPLSLTGQPNAMGGREVGGLANQLAAHMDFTPGDIDRVQRFWNAPNMARAPGKTAVDLFRAIDRGEIRFVWIMGTNPVVSLPDSHRVIKALKKCPTVVVSDCIARTDTADLADILLPAAPWSEKDGTVTNSERRVSRQRALFALSGEARPDWWILSQVAGKLGFSEAFDYGCSADIFREHAMLSGFENSPQGKVRDFNLGPLSRVTREQYDRMEPFQWPLVMDEPSELGETDWSRLSGQQRLFGKGEFYTPDRKARFVATHVSVQPNTAGERYPLLLNTGRVRDHWHTMTRSGLSARLNQHVDEPFLEIHPTDARRLSITDASLCRIESEFGEVIARARVSRTINRGQVFMPMHWTRQNSRTGFSGALVNPVLDPVSKQPDLKFTPVRVEAFQPGRYGVLLCEQRIDFSSFDYATEVRGQACFRYELASRKLDDASVGVLVEMDHPHIERVEYRDSTSGEKRVAWFQGPHIKALWISGCLFSGSDRLWLQGLFQEEIALTDRWRVLAGMPPQGEDSGRQVCACFGVGEKTICRAVVDHGYTDAAEVGLHLKAGTNCGSCVPEIRKLIALSLEDAVTS